MNKDEIIEKMFPHGIVSRHQVELVLDELLEMNDFESKKCVNCKKSIKTYNYMKKFIGYSCKDKLFKEQVKTITRDRVFLMIAKILTSEDYIERADILYSGVWSFERDE